MGKEREKIIYFFFYFQSHSCLDFSISSYFSPLTIRKEKKNESRKLNYGQIKQ